MGYGTGVIPDEIEALGRLGEAEEQVVAALSAIAEPLARARAAESVIQSGSALRSRGAEVRRQALAEAHAAGKGWTEIGRELGISGPRVQQIVQGRSDRRH